MKAFKRTLAPFLTLSTPEQRQQMAADLASPIERGRFFDYEPEQAEKNLHSVFDDLLALAEHSEEGTDAVMGIWCFLHQPLLHWANPPFKLGGLPWDAVVFNDFDKNTALEPVQNWCPWHKLIYVRFAGCDLFRVATDLRAIGLAVTDGPELVAAMETYRRHLFAQYATVLKVIGYSKLSVLWDGAMACDTCHRLAICLEPGPRPVPRAPIPPR